MPYSLPVHAAGHRRSHSGDHGALPSTLPRRRNATPVFHFNNDQDSSSDSDSPHTIPALKLKSRPISFHGAPTAVVPLPLPVQRTNSSPILLSNGKPLKSSLKSSPSAPSMPSSPTEEHPLGPAGRTRASSTPNTPALDHHVPKNVHFPSNKLATVRFYSRSARPASLSLADGGDTETETESERSPYPSFAFPNTKIKGKKMVHTLDTALSSLVPAPSPPAHANVYLESLALHHTSNHAPISSTSSLPFPSSSSSPLSSSTSLSLKGTLLVRNLAYEKTVAVRFTLDEWDTTSEVLAHYTASLPALPPALYVPGSGLQGVHPGVNVGTVDKPAWDRFTFTIRLDDYVPSLATRTLWLVVRYCTPTAGSAFGSGSGSGEGMGIGTEEVEQGGSGNGSNNEWWDNNGGRNYRVVFRLGEESEAESVGKPLPMPVPPPPPPISLRAVPLPLSLPTTSASSTTASPPSSSPTRLRSLSLSNYAAPVPLSPTSPTSSLPHSLSSHLHPYHNLNEHEHEHEHEHEQTHPSPSLSSTSTSTSDGSPSLPTPVDIGMGMEIVNGFPATGPSGLGFGVGLGLDMGLGFAGGTVPGPTGKHEETTHNAHGGKTKSGAISLYWPWGRHHLPSHSPDRSSSPEHEHEHEHAVRVAPPSRQVATHTTLKHLPTRKRHGSPPPPLREPSPTLSDSSSSSSSSGSGSGSSGGGRRPRVGRRVFGPLVSSGGVVGSGPGIPSGFVGRTAMPVHLPTPTNSTTSSPSIPTPTPTPAPANVDLESDKEKMEREERERERERTESDKVYQALVRKWCFAQHPQKQLHQPQHPQEAQHHQEGGGGMHIQGRGRGNMQGRGGMHPHSHHTQGRGDEGLVH